MSVFTSVGREQLEAFLVTYDLGSLKEFAGISDGIVNTNYFVTTEAGRFVLTLFEELNADELPYFIELMRFASDQQVPCAQPISDKNGRYLRELCGKPALVVERLQGRGVDRPTIAQCAAIGDALGRLHDIGRRFGHRRQTDHGAAWHTETAEKVLTVIDGDDAGLLESEMQYHQSNNYDSLPFGLTHGDLFRDNALFDGDKLGGIIDFYYACDFILLHDLAVVINDWCVTEDGEIDVLRMDSLISAYQQHRKISDEEAGYFSAMLRAAALRYWLSRLYDLHFPRAGEITHAKDPNHFRRILQLRVASHPAQI